MRISHRTSRGVTCTRFARLWLLQPPSIPRRVSFDFHGARNVGHSTVTLLPCSCRPAQRSARWLVSKRSSVLRWGRLAPASRSATSAAALAAGKAKACDFSPSVLGSDCRRDAYRTNQKRAGFQGETVPSLPSNGKTDDTDSGSIAQRFSHHPRHLGQHIPQRLHPCRV